MEYTSGREAVLHHASTTLYSMKRAYSKYRWDYYYKSLRIEPIISLKTDKISNNKCLKAAIITNNEHLDPEWGQI